MSFSKKTSFLAWLAIGVFRGLAVPGKMLHPTALGVFVLLGSHSGAHIRRTPVVGRPRLSRAGSVFRFDGVPPSAAAGAPAYPEEFSSPDVCTSKCPAFPITKTTGCLNKGAHVSCSN